MDNYFNILFLSTIFWIVRTEVQELNSDFTTDEKLVYDQIPYRYTWLTTTDGYILKVYHLIANGPDIPPVLLVHGLYSSSNCWILESKNLNKTLAYQLQEKGYNVFLPNLRGNVYSRNHTHLDPENGSKSSGGGMTGFWNFSYHEMGIYDLPLIINYILNKTNQSKLYYIGHNVGSTVYFVLLSEHPEYNSKILLAVQLSPVVFFTNIRNKGTIIGTNIVPGFTQSFLESTSPGELLPKGSSKLLVENCISTKAMALGEIMCVASINQLILCHGKGDTLVDVKDINILYLILEMNYKGANAGNIIPVIISDPEWTSTDFLYAKGVNKLFNEPVMNIMKVFEKKEKGLLNMTELEFITLVQDKYLFNKITHN